MYDAVSDKVIFWCHVFIFITCF